MGEHWKFLGTLSLAEISAFFHECEVTVLPSLNSTESFGMVQVESMLCGTPVVASDLPGVRQPVMISGMGRVVPAADVQALAQAIISILDHPEKFQGDPASIAESFSPETVAVAYEEIFNRLLNREQAKVDKPRYSTKNQP